MQYINHKIIIIAGPTASGKSKLALVLAQQINGIIINSDSSQVYLETPILTSSPSFEDKQTAPHYLYNFLPLMHNFKVTKWLSLLADLIKNTNKTPIIVGGNGFYLSSLINGLSNIPEASQENLLKAQNEFNNMGLQDFKIMLGKIDPIFVNKFHDPYRLIKAYSIFLETNIPMSIWQQQPKKKILNSNFHIFKIIPNRIQLYQNINHRFKLMINIGAINEAINIKSSKIDSIFYKKVIGLNELIEYVNNNISLETAIETASQKTRNYAKRQLTWFKNQLNSAEILENKNPKKTLMHILNKIK